MKIAPERVRRIAMDNALIFAPVFKAQGWEWVGCGGVPGPEDIASQIEELIYKLIDGSHPFYSTGGIALLVVPETDELIVTLAPNTYYVGDDYDSEIGDDLAEAQDA